MSGEDGQGRGDEWLPEAVREARERLGAGLDAGELPGWLASRGYDRRQIGAILVALGLHVDGEAPRPVIADDAAPTFRVMAPFERTRFEPDAWGHLLQMRAAGLPAAELEYLIDRALLHIDGRIALDDLRTLLEGGGPSGGAPGPVTVH